jgi:hypothetical protein
LTGYVSSDDPSQEEKKKRIALIWHEEGHEYNCWAISKYTIPYGNSVQI